MEVDWNWLLYGVGHDDLVDVVLDDVVEGEDERIVEPAAGGVQDARARHVDDDGADRRRALRHRRPRRRRRRLRRRPPSRFLSFFFAVLVISSFSSSPHSNQGPISVKSLDIFFSFFVVAKYFTSA